MRSQRKSNEHDQSFLFALASFPMRDKGSSRSRQSGLYKINNQGSNAGNGLVSIGGGGGGSGGGDMSHE